MKNNLKTPQNKDDTITYSPIGRCIYCGVTNVPLSKEHIIPFGLNGNLILPEASCKACADITSKIEDFCLRPMLGNLRNRLGMKTRRPKKRSPTIPITYTEGDNRKTVNIPANKYPAVYIGYNFPPPGMLENRPPTESIEGDVIIIANTFELDLHRKLDAGFVLDKITTNRLAFMRMLAKIAHSHAVSKLGLNGFKPMLLDLILGRSKIASWLIGVTPLPELIDKENQGLHNLYLKKTIDDKTGTGYLLCIISLFSSTSLPQYEVVVGKL